MIGKDHSIEIGLPLSVSAAGWLFVAWCCELQGGNDSRYLAELFPSTTLVVFFQYVVAVDRI
jgi:hypothetical protein